MLCGKFKIRTRTVKHMCRYCHCPTEEADDPRVKHKKKNPEQIQKLVDKQDIVLNITILRAITDARYMRVQSRIKCASKLRLRRRRSASAKFILLR